MVLSAEGVRKRFIFPSGLWDVFLNTKKMPNPIHCRALSGIFFLKDALGAELFRGVQRGFGTFSGSPEGVRIWSVVMSDCVARTLRRRKTPVAGVQIMQPLLWFD